jgi:hypothetical protein
MVKNIICYKFENMKSSEGIKFKRKLFGAKEKTHRGKYIAVTEGFLTNKEYEKPVRSVIIIEKHYTEGIVKILKEFNANFWIFDIKD